MKSVKYFIFIILLQFSFEGCIKDIVDRKPLNLVSDDDVWQSSDMIDFYLIPIYDNLPFGFTGPYIYSSYLTDEAVFHEEITVVKDFGNLGFSKNEEAYSWIRQINYFLEHLDHSVLIEDDLDDYKGEGYFLRAYYYFDLARKYGGMPIVDSVLTLGDDLGELQLSRDKEVDLWDHILKDLDQAIAFLPDFRDVANGNRATKYTALALKSRAMLYAGSIAKYGSEQLNGLLGIPKEKADFYFEQARDASDEIIKNGPFQLYTNLYDPTTKSGDPTLNYQSIFTDENNSEIIFQKAYSYPDKPNSYENNNVPEGFTTNSGSYIDPSLDLVESYEYIDNSEGRLDVSKAYTTPEEIFANKDPRFEASVLHGGSATGWGRSLQIYRGIYDQNNNFFGTEKASFPLDPSKLQVGQDGPFDDGNYSKTGFYIKKYMNMDKVEVEPNHSDMNFIDIRLAEIYLNYVESVLEMNDEENKSLALERFNDIRGRAGISTITNNELTIPRLRNERKVELAFEDKRFWDIRRWRIGANLFNSTFIKGLWPYLHFKSDGSYTYTYEVKQGYPIDGGQVRVFTQRDYYSNLGGYVSTNPNFIPNPGW